MRIQRFTALVSRTLLPVAVSVSATMLLAACGKTPVTSAQVGTQPTTTIPATSVAPQATLPPTTVGTSPAPIQTTATTSPTSLMPDVVCMNLQAAQDLIQTTGVFFSRSEDATGRGRMQVVDRNWQVVRQTPAPGTPIGEGDAILYVVKYGESPNPC